MAEQRSEEWFRERLGFCTASKFNLVMRGGTKKTYNDYVLNIVAERLSRTPLDEEFTNKHMERGKQQEPEAKMKYEMRTGNVVDEVGFIKHQDIMCGVSPDGIVNNEGTLEIKCVIPKVQLQTLLDGQCPKIHMAQVQGGLWITERPWADFVSYSPQLPEPMNLFIKRVYPDKKFIGELECGVRAFLDDVDTTIIGLCTEYNAKKNTARTG